MARESWQGWIRTGAVIASFLVALAASYTALKLELNNASHKAASVESSLTKLEQQVANKFQVFENRSAVRFIRIEDDVKKDREAVIEIKGDIKAIRQSVETLTRELRTNPRR